MSIILSNLYLQKSSIKTLSQFLLFVDFSKNNLAHEKPYTWHNDSTEYNYLSRNISFVVFLKNLKLMIISFYKIKPEKCVTIQKNRLEVSSMS